jgi:Protein of unknown function (DUF3300)
MLKQSFMGLTLSFLAVFGLVASGFNLTAVAQDAPTSFPALSALDQLLAPVALYPDPLLAQVLTSATSPGQVTEMSKWLQQNPKLQGTGLQEAAQRKGFDASFIALALFPDVIEQMATQIDWTTEVGTAFLSDPTGVMNSVQRLRVQAQAAGNLKATPQQSVTTETQSGQQIIVIQPANPQIVYVPVYNPQVVYYPPPPSTTAVLLAFGAGIAIGVAMTSNASYPPYSWGVWGMGWHTSTVVVRGGVWVVPPHARYPYVRPIPMPYGAAYYPKPYVYAPRTVNVTKVTVNSPGYAGGAKPIPKPYTPVARPATAVAVNPQTGRVTTAQKYPNGVTTAQSSNGSKAAYNPNTRNGAVSQTNANGVKTTRTTQGAQAKTINGKGIATGPNGTTCARGVNNAGCKP